MLDTAGKIPSSLNEVAEEAVEDSVIYVPELVEFVRPVRRNATTRAARPRLPSPAPEEPYGLD